MECLGHEKIGFRPGQAGAYPREPIAQPRATGGAHGLVGLGLGPSDVSFPVAKPAPSPNIGQRSSRLVAEAPRIGK